MSSKRSRATGLAGVPPVWSLLLRSARLLEGQPPEHLRYITNSGGRIPQGNLDELRRLLPKTKIYLQYGLTEAFRSTHLDPAEIDRGSQCIGKPVPNTEILVIKDGRECSPARTVNWSMAAQRSRRAIGARRKPRAWPIAPIRWRHQGAAIGLRIGRTARWLSLHIRAGWLLRGPRRRLRDAGGGREVGPG